MPTPNGTTHGTMEDTGDTYPVCDVCGHIGTSQTTDGDPCSECRSEEND